MPTGGGQLNKEDSRIMNRLMTLAGMYSAKSSVMAAAEMARLIGVALSDIKKLSALKSRWAGDIVPPRKDYFSIDSDWFDQPVPGLEFHDLTCMYAKGKELDDDFPTYLQCLAELHKRRRKYRTILRGQPLPSMVQVSPRALMEYGGDFPVDALASWLTWRKFFYDLDNRAAQETGYLFEPILAAAIGGEPRSARELVVRREDDGTKGRQVDCWKVLDDGTAVAYELKLRVTIAASGQGRFAEELSFPSDCVSSKVLPILVVFDPTPNSKLDQLANAFRKAGGRVYLGDDAWSHLESEAGPTMATFIENYVRKPITRISEQGKSFRQGSGHLNPLPLSVSYKDDVLMMEIGAHKRPIWRSEIRELEGGTQEDED